MFAKYSDQLRYIWENLNRNIAQDKTINDIIFVVMLIELVLTIPTYAGYH